jgi:hypothetical protein
MESSTPRFGVGAASEARFEACTGVPPAGLEVRAAKSATHRPHIYRRRVFLIEWILRIYTTCARSLKKPK